MEKVCSIYVHIPFCKSRCYYCDFTSFANCDYRIKDYIKCLKKEILLYKDKLSEYTIKTIFIGGGTPSYIDARYIVDVMDTIYSCCSVDYSAEITIEANPGTLDVEKLKAYRDANINRLSMGVQSTNDYVLRGLGRIHTYQDFVDNFNLARRVGFSNISVDVMFGVPRQSFSVWKDTLEDIVKLSPEHVSAYSLSIEEGTKFGDMYKEGKISYVDDEEDRRMYHYAIDFLYKHGYCQYEISNFARSGYFSRHNQVYWRNESYVGVGLGAHSYFGGVRYNNVYDMSKYISLIGNNVSASENIEVISSKRDISDYMILGLRLTKGVNIMEFRKRYNQDVMLLFGDRIRKLCKEGLVVCEDDTIMLTNKGKDLANRVFVEFV